MPNEKIKYILSEIKQLNPFEKGKLFSLFFLQEKSEFKGSRKDLKDSIKWEDDEIQLYRYKFDPDDLLK